MRPLLRCQCCEPGFGKVMEALISQWQVLRKATVKYRATVMNGGWVLGLNFFRQLLSLALVVVLVRVLSKDEFGQYQFVVAAVGFLNVFALPGIQTAITQSVARGFDGTYRKAVPVVLASSMLGSAGLAGLACQQWFWGRPSLAPALLAASLLFPFAQGLQHWISFQSGKGLFRLNSIYQGIGFAISNLGGIAAVLLIHPSFVLVTLVTNTVLSVQNVWVSSTVFRRIVPSAPVEEKAISYGIQTSVFGVFNMAGNYMDKFLLFYLLSPEALAVYVVAERIPELLKKYMQSARNILIPGFSRKERFTPGMNRKLNMASWVISAGVIAIALGIVPWFVPLAFTKGYGDAVFYCQLLMGTLIVGQAATTKFTYILSRLDARSFRDITIGTNMVRLSASIILVPYFGIYGAIGATLLYRVSTAVMVNLYVRKLHFSSESAE